MKSYGLENPRIQGKPCPVQFDRAKRNQLSAVIHIFLQFNSGYYSRQQEKLHKVRKGSQINK